MAEKLCIAYKVHDRRQELMSYLQTQSALTWTEGSSLMTVTFTTSVRSSDANFLILGETGRALGAAQTVLPPNNPLELN